MLAHLISISTLVVVASTTCFDNGDKEIQGLCYKFVAQKLSYNDAVNWCHYQNPVTASFLAYVPNQFASNFLASYARTSFGQNDGNFWIGLSRATTSSPWKWDSGDSLQFTNFDSSQLGQNYAAESIVKSNWGTFSSDQKMNFVCSYNPSAPPTFVPNTAVPSTPTPTAGIPTTTTQNVPTTTGDGKCHPATANSTFFFGYSTETDHDVFMAVKKNVLDTLVNDPRNYKRFADVRFDNRNGETIFYHDDIQSFTQSLQNHPPNKLLGYQDLKIPSDMFPVLQKFLSNPSVDLCGARLFLLMVPNPNINDDNSLDYTNLGNNHVLAYIIKTQYGGGISPDPVKNFAALTNGLVVYADDVMTNGNSDFNTVARLYLSAPYTDHLWFSPSYLYLFNETATSQYWSIPDNGQPVINATLAITTSNSDSYQDSQDAFTINLKFAEKETGRFTIYPFSRKDLMGNTDLIWTTIELDTGVSYAITVEQWASREESVEVRIWI